MDSRERKWNPRFQFPRSWPLGDRAVKLPTLMIRIERRFPGPHQVLTALSLHGVPTAQFVISLVESLARCEQCSETQRWGKWVKQSSVSSLVLPYHHPNTLSSDASSWALRRGHATYMLLCVTVFAVLIRTSGGSDVKCCKTPT
jgi:hypothetical protein